MDRAEAYEFLEMRLRELADAPREDFPLEEWVTGDSGRGYCMNFRLEDRKVFGEIRSNNAQHLQLMEEQMEHKG